MHPGISYEMLSFPGVVCVGFVWVLFLCVSLLIFCSKLMFVLCFRWSVGDVASPYKGAIKIWNTKAPGTLGPILNAMGCLASSHAMPGCTLANS